MLQLNHLQFPVIDNLEFHQADNIQKTGTISNPIFFAWAFNLEKERKKERKKEGAQEIRFLEKT